ncbi:antibiotic resistance protein VanZ [Bacillus cereus]|uniref:antibiotic resistance protein VanZ n=1 Tax=Bacillus cereus TaxID=1396 RepID=UPI0020160727|nr:antibiotic resistance protein VanZ [Bacillus cereus]
MFYGTRFGYNLLYFVTAMSPAYFLFLLQVNEKFKKPFDRKILGVDFNIYTWCLVLFIILFLMAFILKILLKMQFTRGLGTPVLTNKLDGFSKSNIEETNGSVVSFLLGNIIPVVLIMENSIKEAIVVFLLLQIIIYLLTVKSSEIFPNIVLIILGVDICKTKDGNYLLIFNGQDEEMLKVYQIGDVRKSRLYITAYKK